MKEQYIQPEVQIERFTDAKIQTANGKSADNEVDFGGGSTASDNKGTTSTTCRQNKTSTTSKAKEPATDSEGWVTKWY